MELRSLQLTLYIGALTLVACGSSSTNSSPFESATTTPNVRQDASTGNTSSGGGSGNGSSSGGGSVNSSSGGGTDNTPTPSTCSVDSDCNGGCCDPNALTCFTPEGGSCPSAGDDGGGSGDDSGTPPI
jgi:hypothetical protein